ncbi:MAG: hypothetical protein WEB03_09195, partial [Nitriliruptor sp.]
MAATVLAGLLLSVLLIATSNTGPALVNDTRAAALASWSLGTQGELALPEPWPASANYWGVTTPDGRVHVNRFPGVALWATPAYAVAHLAAGSPDPPAHPFLVDLRPAGWSAALTVVAVAVAAFALLRRVVPRWWAAGAALVVTLGTGMWSVAADALWPHGPAALGLVALLLGWRRLHEAAADVAGAVGDVASRVAGGVEGTTVDGVARQAAGGGAVLAGIGATTAVLVRPHLAVATVVIGAWVLIRERAARRAGVAAMAGTAVGLALLSLYSWRVFGVWTPTAGYDVGGHLGGLVTHSPWQTLRSFGAAFIGLERGLLVWSPVVAVALVAACWQRRRVPPWTVVAAIAGLAYLLVQVRAVGHFGGAHFFGPRISLEALVLATPLLATGVWHAGTAAAASGRVSRAAAVAVLVIAAVGSVGWHAFGAVARSTSPEQVARWEEIDRTVHRDFGDLDLGDVDL